MKRTLTLIACVAVCCAMMVSCKNAKTAEPTPEEIQAQKVALADSVLAEIDAIAEQYFDATSKKFTFRSRELTAQEKSVKPDYLLEPSVVNSLVTKSQKINALGILTIDLGVRYLYNMPVDETKEAIAKLALELNFSNDMLSPSENQQDVSEITRNTYNYCKANNELSAFWQNSYALAFETYYILAQNPELYFSKISEDEWHAFTRKVGHTIDALKEIAPYDPEIAQLLDILDKTRAFESDEARDQILSTLQSTKEFFIANKDKFIARRNALLQ